VSSRHEAKYYKTTLRVRGSVPASENFACIGADTARGGNSETRAFDAISISSVQKRVMFHVIAEAGTLLFRNTKQRQKGNAVACSKPPTLETYSDSVLYFIGYNAAYLRHKGTRHHSQTDPLDAPLHACNPFWREPGEMALDRRKVITFQIFMFVFSQIRYHSTRFSTQTKPVEWYIGKAEVMCM